MDKLPIDIHSGRLLKWLISRRHCNTDWSKRVLEIREKIGNAMKDMPENDRICQLLQGSHIHYFKCKEIVEILKETEKDTKNIFGSYSSQRMKDWQEILKLYEKDNVYLAEAANFLQHLVQFDIPASNRLAAKEDQGGENAIKKQEDYKKQAVAAKRAYIDEIKRMGISGENVRKEVVGLTSTVQPFVDDVLARIQLLAPALEYHDAFIDYCTSNEVPDSDLEADSDVSEAEAEADPALQKGKGKKNKSAKTKPPVKDKKKKKTDEEKTLTAFEALLKEAAAGLGSEGDSVPLPSLVKAAKEEYFAWQRGDDTQTQLNGDANRVAANKALTFLRRLLTKAENYTYFEDVHGRSPTTVERPKVVYVEEAAADDEIDFGDDDDGIDFGDGAGGDTINFDIDDFAIEVVGGTEETLGEGEAAVAIGEEALGVLEHSATITKLITELRALASFLEQRIRDEKTDFRADLYTHEVDIRPPELAAVKTNSLEEWHAIAVGIIADYVDDQKRKLLRLNASPAYVDELVDAVEKLKAKEGRFLQMADLMVAKEAEALESARRARQQAEGLIATLEGLKDSIEADISKRYDRECNIIGEIYNVLP